MGYPIICSYFEGIVDAKSRAAFKAIKNRIFKVLFIVVAEALFDFQIKSILTSRVIKS